MTGWSGWMCQCAVAWRLGESSQQPTWPQCMQSRRWTQRSPRRRQSSQPLLDGTTSPRVSRCAQVSTIAGSGEVVDAVGFEGGAIPLQQLGGALVGALEEAEQHRVGIV